MSKEITFMDKASSNEYKDQMEKQGYKMSTPREQNGGYVVKILSDRNADDVDVEASLRKALSERDERVEETQGKKFVRHMGRGITDIAKSMAHPSDKRRMKIAQMVEGKDNPMRTVRVSNPIAGHGAGTRRHDICPDAHRSNNQ